MKDSAPFIPRDKPRSWVVGVLAGLSGLAAGLVAFVGAWLGFAVVKFVGIVLFVACWLAFAGAWLVFMIGLVSGRYAKVEPREWSDQVW